MGEAAGRPELAVADAVDPGLDLFAHRFRNGANAPKSCCAEEALTRQMLIAAVLASANRGTPTPRRLHTHRGVHPSPHTRCS
jgi:hypothetical protein